MGAGKSTARVVTRKYYPRPGSIFYVTHRLYARSDFSLRRNDWGLLRLLSSVNQTSAVFCDAVTMALPSAFPPVVAAAPQKRRCSNTFLADVI